jgi:predicted AlkP superfamily phosphohydrolase/phosphomutase
MMNGSKKRFLAIALDGATFDLIRPLAARGELPCIGEMMARGSSAPLLSTIPAITPPAWSSFATGAPPETHGVFGFNYPDAQDYSLRLTTMSDLQRPTLWRQLSRRGLRVLLLDVPFTFPPEPVNGCAIAGFPLPTIGPFTHPPDLAEQLESAGVACARHPVEAPDPTAPGFMKWLDKFMNDRLQIFRHLTAQKSWQFAMVGTMALDWAQHALWKYFDRRFVFSREPEAAERRETLFAIYRRVDRFVADLMETAGNGTDIIIVSDHGFGATFHYDWVSEALAQAGLLFWRGGGRGLAARVGATALKAVRSSARLQRLGKKLLGDTTAARAWARRARAYSRIDWERTRIFPAGDYHLNLYVNSRARFARGIVAAGADYEKVLGDAIAALETFRPPHHNEPLVRRIIRYEGGAKGLPTRVPDLSLEINTLPMPSDSEVVAPLAGICGFHAPEGVLISSATSLFSSARDAKREITEIAPMILGYYGIPLDEGDLVEPTGPSQALSAEQSAAVLDSLRHLGYLD